MRGKNCLKHGFIFSAFSAFILLVQGIQAQVMMEFTWTLDGTSYEGLLYVPRDKPATMTVRVLDARGNLEALVLERVDLISGENDAVILQCSSPKIIEGPADRKHLPESFSAQNDARGKVTNGRAEALYEINTINSQNIGQTIQKYLKKH